MDPDENLRRQIEMANEFIALYEGGGRIASVDANDFAKLVIALDEWIRKGGFLPSRWHREGA